MLVLFFFFFFELLFFFLTQVFCGGKGLEPQWFYWLLPKSCLPLPPSGLMTNSKTLHVVLRLFLTVFIIAHEKRFP